MTFHGRIMARIVPACFLGLFVCLCFQGKVLSALTGRDACSSISTVASYFGNCISVLGALNRTTHTQEEVCQMYNEVANCLRNKVMAKGESCDMSHLHATLSKYATHTTWIKDLQVQSCQVVELSESICSAPDRLGMVTLLTCGKPIIGGFTAASQSGFICSAISGLDVCTDNFLHLLGDQQCSRDDIKNGLMSSVGQKWISSHYPGIDLEQCFTVYQPGQTTHDSECTDLAYISRHTQQAMGIMYLNNVTSVGQQNWCRTYYYAIHLLQHEMEQQSHVCSITDLQNQMSKLLGYQGVSDATLTACQGEMSITPAEFCGNQMSVLQVMANEPYCKPYIRRIASSKNDNETCMYVKQFIACSETKLKYAGFQCDTSSVFRANNLSQYMTNNYHITLPSTC